MTLPPHYILVRAACEWNGQLIEARDALPAEAWEIETVRDQVKRVLRYSIAQAIAERLDIRITATPEGTS